jgi:CheY-like chemotaxis protein
LKGNVVKQLYRRGEDLDEKLKEITLPYLSWKILFLISDETSVDELKKQLKKEKGDIEDAIALLLERGVIEATVPGDVEVADESVSETAELEEQLDEAQKESEVLESEKEFEGEEASVLEETPEKSAEPEATEETESNQISDELQEMDLEEPAVKEEEESEEAPPDLPEVDLEESRAEEKSSASPGEAEVDLTLDESAQDQQPSEEYEKEHEVIDLDEREEEEETVDLDFEESQIKEDDGAGPESADMSNLIEELDEMGGNTPKTAAEDDSAAAKTQEKKVSGGKTIMVVDDSIVIRKMVEIALEEDDYRIITATSGKEGMTVLDAENPDLVILDMMLPDMSGIDLLKTIKASRGIPVIMLSGKDSPQLIETAKGVGADDFLPKPFRDEELVEKVKTLLK